jgi:hypothetical protein
MNALIQFGYAGSLPASRVQVRVQSSGRGYFIAPQRSLRAQ